MANQLNEKFEKSISQYQKKVKKMIESDEQLAALYQTIKASPKQIFGGLSRSETKKYDTQWVDEIQAALVPLETIVRNPKKFIKQVYSIVPVELAKKTTAESVRHLASHSQYVKEIDAKGNVIPDKILNVGAEDNYAIYENRFIMTLIRKLMMFVELRYDYIEKHGDTKNSDTLTATSLVEIDGLKYEYETKIRLVEPSSDEGNRESNEELLVRIIDLRRRILYLNNTEFMKMLKNENTVKSPIMQTNIIRKNLEYNACYKLWKFLDKYDELGIAFNVTETKATFKDAYLEQLYTMMLHAYITVDSERRKPAKATKKDVSKLKIVPKFVEPILDKELDNDRFRLVDHGKRVRLSKYTPQQEAELEKKRLAKEKEERLKKERAIAKKQREKQRKIDAAIRKKQMLQAKKEARALAKKQEEARIRAEILARKEIERQRKREAMLMAKEKAALEAERKRVMKEALKAKKAREMAEAKKAKELEKKRLAKEKKAAAKKARE